jgi:hypothetical protein
VILLLRPSRCPVPLPTNDLRCTGISHAIEHDAAADTRMFIAKRPRSHAMGSGLDRDLF